MLLLLLLLLGHDDNGGRGRRTGMETGLRNRSVIVIESVITIRTMTITVSKNAR